MVTAPTRLATATDLDRAAEVLGDAFRDYPWTKWTVDPDDHQVRVTGLQRAALEHLGLPYGEVWVTEVDGTIHSVAVIMSSLVAIPQSAKDAAHLVRKQLEGSRFETSYAAGERLTAWLPNEPYLYLGTIGTTTSMQGRGLGRMTLSPVLSRSDSTQMPILLETSSSDNVEFYQNLGFRIERHWLMEDDGPHVWAMRRDPSQFEVSE
jgi:predicted GNAT family N-acyltransferase